MNSLTQMPESAQSNRSQMGMGGTEKTNNAQIISLLSMIILGKKEFTEKHYHATPILPNIPVLGDISAAIQQTLGNQSLDSKLLDITSLLRNESNCIKKMELHALLYTMQKQRARMGNTQLMGNARHDALLNNVIHSILPLSALQEREILKICATCLCELGAIDFGGALHSHQKRNSSAPAENGHGHEEKEVIVLDDDEDSNLRGGRLQKQ